MSFHSLSKPKAWLKGLVVLAHLTVGAVCVRLNVIEAAWIKEGMMLLGIYASILLISMLESCKPIARFLSFMNKYSFQTYLLHTIFTAGVRIALLRLGITRWWIHVPAGIVCGIACSVLAAIIAQRIPLLNFFFFPTRAFRKKNAVRG